VREDKEEGLGDVVEHEGALGKVGEGEADVADRAGGAFACDEEGLAGDVLCFLYVFVGPRSGRYLFFGSILGILAGATNILGTMLYADTLRVGLSFLIFIGGAFLFFGAMATVTASFGSDTAGGEYKPQRDPLGLPVIISPGGPSVAEEENPSEGGYLPPQT